jgi:hypothetical protein
MRTVGMARNAFAVHFLLHAADFDEERLRRCLAPLGLRPRLPRVIYALWLYSPKRSASPQPP